MTDIPTNALRQRLAEILRRVAAGESFRITRRGRVLAVVVPPNLFQQVVSISLSPPVVTPVIVSEFRPPLTGRSVASPEEEFALLEQARRDAIPLGEFGTSAYFRAIDRDRETYRERYREWLASREVPVAPHNPADAPRIEEFMPVTPEMKAAALLYLTPLTPILESTE